MLWATSGIDDGWGCQALQTPFLPCCPANLLREQESISSVAPSLQHRPTCLSVHLFLWPSSACFRLSPCGSGGGGSSSAASLLLSSERQGCVSCCPPGCRNALPLTFCRVSAVHLPLHGISSQEASVLSEPLDVPVFLTQDGDLVLEQDRVEPHLGVHQRHAAKPAGELVHAGLPLSEVVRISPAGGSRRLVGTEKGKIHIIIRILSIHV